jgi:hypothetical protein
MCTKRTSLKKTRRKKVLMRMSLKSNKRECRTTPWTECSDGLKI